MGTHLVNLHMMRSQVFIFIQVLVISCTYSCETADCDCGDWFYDNCHAPPSTIAVHADSLQECSANCKVFASMDQCKYYTYDINGYHDENCLLYQTSPDNLLQACGIQGQPLYNSAGESITTESCASDPCRGYRSLDCLLTSFPVSSSWESSGEECAAMCRGGAATYSVYTQESTRCECYDSGERECAYLMLDLETPITC